MMSMPSKEFFNTLNVYNFTSKRPELVLVYQTIINIDGVGNYTVSDVELEFEPGNEYKYADIMFTINIK